MTEIPKGLNTHLLVILFVKHLQLHVPDLSILNERTDLQTPAFYILLEEDENTKPKVYIGETENFKERVKDHDSKKFFGKKP